MYYRRFFGFPTLEARNPFSELERVRRQLERVFEGPAMARRDLAGVFPLINLTENKDSFFVRAELPGLKPEDLDIQATANSVSISGERKIPAEDKNARYHRREREAGRFSRVVGLPSEIDSGKVDASLVNGVLTVVVPKAEMAKPRQISVK